MEFALILLLMDFKEVAYQFSVAFINEPNSEALIEN